MSHFIYVFNDLVITNISRYKVSDVVNAVSGKKVFDSADVVMDKYDDEKVFAKFSYLSDRSSWTFLRKANIEQGDNVVERKKEKHLSHYVLSQKNSSLPQTLSIDDFEKIKASSFADSYKAYYVSENIDTPCETTFFDYDFPSAYKFQKEVEKKYGEYYSFVIDKIYDKCMILNDVISGIDSFVVRQVSFPRFFSNKRAEEEFFNIVVSFIKQKTGKEIVAKSDYRSITVRVCETVGEITESVDELRLVYDSSDNRSGVRITLPESVYSSVKACVVNAEKFADLLVSVLCK